MISRRRAGVSITQSPPSCWLYIQPTTDCAKNPRTTLKFSEIFLLLSILLVSKETVLVLKWLQVLFLYFYPCKVSFTTYFV